MSRRTPAQRRRFILKLVRMQNAIDVAHERAAEAYDIDSEMDGGEFSGPAHARAIARAEIKIVQRFGFTHPEWAYTAVKQMGCTLRTGAHLIFGGPAPLPR